MLHERAGVFSKDQSALKKAWPKDPGRGIADPAEVSSMVAQALACAPSRGADAGLGDILASSLAASPAWERRGAERDDSYSCYSCGESIAPGDIHWVRCLPWPLQRNSCPY